MTFLRVVEVLPPVLPLDGARRVPEAQPSIAALVDEVRAVKGAVDLLLVSTMKAPHVAQVSAVTVAALIQERAGVRAAPTIVVRDSNKLQFRSQLFTAFSMGLESVMIAWGDRLPPGHDSRNSYDYPSLSGAISEAAAVAERSGIEPRIFAPVDIDRLRTPAGVRLAKSRVAAGARLLLAQPPTTDHGSTMRRHTAAIGQAGLSHSVLPGVFPFRDAQDAKAMASSFGWTLPRSAYASFRRGRRATLDEARAVVRAVRNAGYPGVYLSTRGWPRLALDVLD